jgi:uncharacterized ubiquitin-like protein YukD
MKKVLMLFMILSPMLILAQGNIDKSGYTNNNWNYVGQPGFAYGGLWSQGTYVSMAFGPSDQPYVAFTDWMNDGKATVMKFDGIQWVHVGNVGFSDGTAGFIKLIFDSTGKPFIAYMDEGLNQKSSVMKLEGENWVSVGNPGFSDSTAFFTSLAFSSSGELFVAYSDFKFDGKATVKKFDGNNWIDVGNPHFSEGVAYYLSLTFNDSSEPCVGYSDYAHYGRATVKRFDGNSWISIGNDGFSASEAWDINLELNPIDHRLYVCYADFDWSGSNYTTVKEFIDTTWIDFGNPGFSPGGVAYPSFKISNEGKFYVAFGDFADNYKATAMTYDPSGWELVGNEGFSGGDEVWENELAINQNGIPYFAFNDRGHNTDSCRLYVMKYDSIQVGIHNLSPVVSVYPNPAVKEITFDFSKLESNKINLEIFTINGIKKTQRNLAEKKIRISLNDFPNGLYFYRVTTDKSSFTGKFVKN